MRSRPGAAAGTTRVRHAERVTRGHLLSVRVVVAGLTGAVGILAAVGVSLAIKSPPAAGTGHEPDGEVPAVGSTLTTSFGSLQIGGVQRSDGLSSEDLGGMTHGVQSLVSAGNTTLTAEFTVVNATDHPVRVTSKQFTLLRAATGDTAPLPPTGTTLTDGELPARSSVEAEVSFVVPSDGAPLRLSYHDPGGDPLVVDLGGTTVASPEPPAAHEHQH